MTARRYGHNRGLTVARKQKIAVPINVRRAVLALCAQGGGMVAWARRIGVSEGMMAELVTPGGLVQPTVLERVAARLVELQQGGAPK